MGNRWSSKILLQITVIMSLSVTVAMYCLLQVYVPISSYLKPQKPLLKLVAVKAVGSSSMFQNCFLVFHDTSSLPHILAGIWAILACNFRCREGCQYF